MVSRDDSDQLATGILLSPMRGLTSASRRGSEACAQTQLRSLGLPLTRRAANAAISWALIASCSPFSAARRASPASLAARSAALDARGRGGASHARLVEPRVSCNVPVTPMGSQGPDDVECP